MRAERRRFSVFGGSVFGARKLKAMIPRRLTGQLALGRYRLESSAGWPVNRGSDTGVKSWPAKDLGRSCESKTA